MTIRVGRHIFGLIMLVSWVGCAGADEVEADSGTLDQPAQAHTLGETSAALAGGGSGASTACGSVTCSAGEFCCNVSCSICAPVGGGCTDKFCE